MGALCSGSDTSVIDDDLMNEMKEIVGKSVRSIPDAYKVSLQALFINKILRNRDCLA
jgi:hypothetical protein